MLKLFTDDMIRILLQVHKSNGVLRVNSLRELGVSIVIALERRKLRRNYGYSASEAKIVVDACYEGPDYYYHRGGDYFVRYSSSRDLAKIMHSSLFPRVNTIFTLTVVSM